MRPSELTFNVYTHLITRWLTDQPSAAAAAIGGE